MGVEWGHVPLRRSTCFRSGKARTGTLGWWEYAELACRDCQVWESLCICVRSFYKEGLNVWEGHSGEGFFFDDTAEGLGTLSWGLDQLLAANPVGTSRMAWWKRGVRTESLSSSSCTSIQSLTRYLPGTHPREGLSEVFRWQAARIRSIAPAISENLHWPDGKMYFYFYSSGILWFDFMWTGFTEEHSWSFSCVGLFNGFGLNQLSPVFFPLLLPSPTVYPYSNFPYLRLPFSLKHPSLLSLFFLSVIQGQRHEESAGFPTEEEWVPRKQPSWQDRQIHEVNQVSGHFLAACVCVGGGVFVCVAAFRVVSHHSWQWPGLRSQSPGQRLWCGLVECVYKKKAY